MFAIASSTIPLILLLALLVLAVMLVLYRPLLLSTVSAEMAAARGIPVRLVGALYLLALALATALAAITIGTILCTALLVGPAATALRLTKRPLRAMLAAAGIGVGAMWLGIVLAYDSFYWPPAGHGWPVSFFVVTPRIRRPIFSPGCPGAAPPATRPRAMARARWPAARRAELGAQMFSGFMVNAWTVASIVAVVAGVVGFFTVLRGSAFVAHAIPNGSFAGAAGASLLGLSTLLGLGVFSLAGALGSVCSAAADATTSRPRWRS